GSLWRFWFTRGYMLEGQETLEAVLERGAEASGVSLLVRARALTAAGEMAWGRGDLDRATRHHRASLLLRRELGDLEGVAQALHLGDGDCAAERYAECLRLACEIGAQITIARGIETAAMVLSARGDLSMAAQLIGAAETIRDAIRSPRVPTETAPLEPAIAAGRAQLGEARFQRTHDAGRDWT